MEGFYIFAIRVNSENSTGKRKLCVGKIYYLTRDWKVCENGELLLHSKSHIDNLYNDYFFDSNIKITVSAIVGENGAGKSSLVEFIIRMINNLATMLFGEKNFTKSYEHLHYIDGIDGDLFFCSNDIPYRLSVKNRNITLEYYSKESENNNITTFIRYNTPNVFDNQFPIHPDIDIRPLDPWKEPKGEMQPKEILEKHFFYTLAINYSMYAYNSNDYQDECSPDWYENLIRKTKNPTIDERCWLNGLFHKNDGYQVPLVLSPYRDKGNIDINIENSLAKERLIALVLMSNDGFREINGHLKVTGFICSIKQNGYNAKKLRTGKYYNFDETGFKKAKALTLKYWGEAINVAITQFENQRRYYDIAIDYLTYKTLKISAIYKQYKHFWRNHKSKRSKIDEKMFSNLVYKISIDHSHITKKIRQILGYIVYGNFEIEADDKIKIPVELAGDKARSILTREKESPIGKRFLFSLDDLVPPPIFDVDIDLNDMVNDGKTDVPFRTLSSGERQQAYFVSSILYHLSNLNSVHDDDNHVRISYKNVLVFLEEIELYFHPQLQKNLVNYLFDGIRQVNLSHISNVHFCIITHSPFVLSDISRYNILALKKDNAPVEELKTFGANYYDMLKYNFFFDKGTVGDFAQSVINRIILILNLYEYGKATNESIKDKVLESRYFRKLEERNGWDMERIKQDFPREKLEMLIDAIDEPIIKKCFIRKMNEIFEDIDMEAHIRKQIADHEAQIKALQDKLDQQK